MLRRTNFSGNETSKSDLSFFETASGFGSNCSCRSTIFIKAQQSRMPNTSQLRGFLFVILSIEKYRSFRKFFGFSSQLKLSMIFM